MPQLSSLSSASSARFQKLRQRHNGHRSPPPHRRKEMFFHIVLERNMQLHPRHFGRDLWEKLTAKLMKDVEGTCSGRHGFIVATTGIESVGKGLIRDGTGFISFPVKYQCVVFRPFKGEVLEAMGFFTEAGPVQVFVSSHDVEVMLKLLSEFNRYRCRSLLLKPALEVERRYQEQHS